MLSTSQQTKSPDAASARHAPVLLTSSRFLGTLAAVRSFGRAGIASVVADDTALGPASWSRFVNRRVKCPPESQPEQLLAALLAFGKVNPGHVLCATSDESAWLYSKHREELGHYFHLYQPSVDAVYSLLNKRRLYQLATAENVDVPRTWFPQSEAELQEVLKQARFPVLTKPVTQILHKTHTKGAVIEEASEVARFFLFMANQMHQPELLAIDPSVMCPMVQEFQVSSAQGVHSVSGFIDESGTVRGARATKKILQRPRRLGVGVCFERAEVNPALVDAISRMCRRIGYYGAFEVEFIHRDGQDLLIDFNPRFYGQMAFDIARGLPVPLFTYHAALGNWNAVDILAQRARQDASDDTMAVFCNRSDFEIMLRLQRFGGGMSATEVDSWRNWYRQHRGHIVHPIHDSEDWKPFAVEVVRQGLEHARHPRAALKSSMVKALMLYIQLDQRGLGLTDI